MPSANSVQFRRGRLLVLLAACLAGVMAGCSSEASPTEPATPLSEAGVDATQGDDGALSDALAQEEGSSGEAAVDALAEVESPDATGDSAASCADKAKNCATEFGALFTKANGRADGTLVALVRPVDQQCTAPNNDHAVVQLSILGQVQRLVVSVDGVAVMSKAAPLLGAPYKEGWHTGSTLDYVSDLGVHSTDFTSVSMDQAVTFLCEHLTVGAPVSVYAYCDGNYPTSAHQIHYNEKYPDGAIVLNPTSANPTWLLFRYENQVF
jgi:hypothetical protein